MLKFVFTLICSCSEWVLIENGSVRALLLTGFIRAVLHVTQYYSWFSHLRGRAPWVCPTLQSWWTSAAWENIRSSNCHTLIISGFVVAEYHGLPLMLICDCSDRALIGSAVNMLQICCYWSGLLLSSKCLSVITDTVQYTRWHVFLLSCFYATALILKKLQICPTNKAAVRASSQRIHKVWLGP